MITKSCERPSLRSIATGSMIPIRAHKGRIGDGDGLARQRRLSDAAKDGARGDGPVPMRDHWSLRDPFSYSLNDVVAVWSVLGSDARSSVGLLRIW